MALLFSCFVLFYLLMCGWVGLYIYWFLSCLNIITRSQQREKTRLFYNLVITYHYYNYYHVCFRFFYLIGILVFGYWYLVLNVWWLKMCYWDFMLGASGLKQPPPSLSMHAMGYMEWWWCVKIIFFEERDYDGDW